MQLLIQKDNQYIYYRKAAKPNGSVIKIKKSKVINIER